jgi:hypothetical protein
MSCCGESRPKDGVRPIGTLQPYPITTQQPSPHPVITPFQEKPFQPFQPPNIVSPPPVHASPHLNGGTQSPPPQSSSAHGPLPPNSPGPTLPQMGTYSRAVVDPAGSLSPLRRPSAAYGPTRNPNILSTYQGSATPMPTSIPPTDEGKMSVSIDFGEPS